MGMRKGGSGLPSMIELQPPESHHARLPVQDGFAPCSSRDNCSKVDGGHFQEWAAQRRKRGVKS